MAQFPRLFSIPLQILCRCLACKSITSILKCNAYKDRHISFILQDDETPSFTSKRILYLQEYKQPVGHLVLPCNTFRMLVIVIMHLYESTNYEMKLFVSLSLTLFQMTKFRPFQTKSVCIQQF